MLIPLLVSGAFFPIDRLPDVLFAVAQLNPLHHCVELIRHAVFGFKVTDLAQMRFLIVFTAVMWALAVRLLRQRLID